MKKYLLKIKKLIILIFIAYGVLSLINIFNPIINAKLLTSLTNFNLNEAYKYTFIFFVISILSVLINKLAIKLLGKIHEKLLYDIRYDIIQRLFKLKMKNFDEIPSGKFQERIKNDPEGIFSVFSVVQYNIFNIITEVFMLAYVMYLNIIIGLIYILGIIIIYFYEKYAYEKFEKLEEESKIQREKSGTILNEILRGIRDIKLLGITNKVNKMTSETLDKQSKLDTKISISRMNIYNTTEIVKDILIFIIIFLGIFLININKLTLTTFLIIFMYRNDIFSLVFSYTSLKEYLVKYKVAKNRIMELFDNKKFPIETYGNESIDNIKGEIEFKNVSFAYNKKEIIHNVSFKVNPLEDVALVGKSGSGKSTLFNLLTKSYDNYEGIITIDGVDIKKLNQKTLIDSISIISQNPYIFNLSIKDNLKLIDKNITDDDIINACKTARIHDFIETLPDKYNTLLGEGGVNLSGGQKQRLAIARALLKQSKILLFDEATSSLDNITQDEIQTAIKSISKNFTIITIAHRLSTIINSNKIYLLEEGNIIACGTHKELLKSNTYYKELYNK
ncbi:putative lipid A export ATP-binding/permease protein MsbA [Clostridium sp. CAG:914]|nr:putative lipid A export ATP-binding/permease protein MsbA [Clostridium sp. CAG:914]